MNEARKVVMFIFVVALCLSGCGDGGSAGGAAPAMEEAADAGSSDQGCAEGFDSGPGEVFRSFESIDAGRYCEVLVVFAEGDGEVMADVYNSLVFGSCPQALWEQLDADVIKEEFADALLVRLNGPRYFLMQHLLDAPTQSGAPVLHDFGGIMMVKLATVSTRQGVRHHAAAPITKERRL